MSNVKAAYAKYILGIHLGNVECRLKMLQTLNKVSNVNLVLALVINFSLMS